MGKRLWSGVLERELVQFVLFISVSAVVLGSVELPLAENAVTETYCPWLFADEYVNSWQRVHSASEAPGLGSLDQLNHCWGPKAVNATQKLPLIAGTSLLAGNDRVSRGTPDTSGTNIFVFIGSCWSSTQHIPYRSFELQLAGKPSWRLLGSSREPDERWGFSLCSDRSRSSVLLHGGIFGTGQTATGVEFLICRDDTWLFDADQMVWFELKTTGGKHGCRAFHAAATLEDNSGQQVMAAFGGCLDSVDGVNCEAHDTLSVLRWNKTSLFGTWEEVNRNSSGTPWPEARRSAHAVTTVKGSVLMFGGYASQTQSKMSLGRNQTELHDLWELEPQTMQWTHLATVTPFARSCPSYFFAYHASSNRVLFMCQRYGSHPKHDDRVWIYDYSNGKWGDSHYIEPITSTGMSMFRWLLSVSSDSDSYIIGYNEDYRTDSIWKFTYDIERSPQGMWSTLNTDLTTPDPLFLADISQDENNFDVFYAGGHIGSTINAPRMLAKFRVWLYMPNRNTWSILENPLSDPPPPSFGHTITLMTLPQRTLFLFGGIVHNGTDTLTKILDDRLWCFDVSTALWQTHTASASEYSPQSRVFGVAALVNNALVVHGGLVCAGGECDEESNKFLVQTADVFLPYGDAGTCRGHWDTLHCSGPTMPALFGHTAISFGSYALIFGGASFNGEGLILHRSLWKLQFESSSNCSWSLLNQSSMPPPAVYFHSATRMRNKMVVSGGCLCTHASCTWQLIDMPAAACSSHSISLDHIWLFDTVTLEWMRIDLAMSLTPLSMHVSFMVGNILFALGGMGNATSTASAQLPSDLSMRHRQYAVGLACPLGTYSTNILQFPCLPCPLDTYSDIPGVSNCTACPAQLHTSRAGATDRSGCDVCHGDDVCHGNGECSVDTSQMPTCQCQFGFTSYDNCRVPYYYIVLCAGLLIISFLIILLVRAIHRRHKQQRQFSRQLSMSRSEVAQLASAWKIEPDELVLRTRLDTKQPGAFGEVWLGEYRDMPVAVKRLQIMHLHSRSRLEFEREARVMRTIRHPNIVLFLGAGFEGNRPFLVLEYMQRGTLYSVLRDGSFHIDHHQEVKFALDIAKGMRYLHGLEPPRIHRDLKTANLLVSEKWAVKVGDFGTARLISNLQEQQTIEQVSSEDDDEPLLLASAEGEEDTPLLRAEAAMTRHTGTVLYCAPEVLLSKAYGAAADTYSFGIILWEIYSREDPFSEFPDLKFMVQVMDAVTDGCRPTVPQKCPPAYASLIRDCWQPSSHQRPTFSKIVEHLLQIQTDLESYVVIPSPSVQESQHLLPRGNIQEPRDLLSGDDSDL